MRTLDTWLIARTKSMLDFLFDWFGITQKLVERTLIVIFGLTYFIKVASIFIKAPGIELTPKGTA